jgi:phosphate transport system permease protein
MHLRMAQFDSESLPRTPTSITFVVSCYLAVLTAAGLGFLVLLFAWQSIPAWQHSGFRYLSGTRWYYRAQEFGALPMIYGTIVVSTIALLLATPIGIGAAIFTSEFLPERLRLAVKVFIELLAGVPSVVYGLLGILFLRNWIYRLFAAFDPISGDTLLTAGVLLAVMILPTMMTLSEDALRSVPRAQRDAARGLGLTRAESVYSVIVPQAWNGIVAATLLALGRALGETIAVFLVVGRQDNQWLGSIFAAGQTLTSKLGGSETNIAYGAPLHWAAMVGLALILVGGVVGLTLASDWIQQRKVVHATFR